MPSQDLVISPALRIPAAELRFTYSRSPGPGGQNVNKVNTRVTLTYDVQQSTALSDSQRARILRRLENRIDHQGQLRVVASQHRSQSANSKAAVERLAALLRDALARRKPRIPTRTPRSAVKRRLENKARRSQRKKDRRRPSLND